jgi:hypothetical protein
MRWEATKSLGIYVGWAENGMGRRYFRNIRRSGPMLDVVPTSSRRLQRYRPILISLREAPHLVRGQAEFAERRPERLAAVDRVEELLAHFGGKSLLRPGSSASSLVVGVRSTAEGRSGTRCASPR